MHTVGKNERQADGASGWISGAGALVIDGGHFSLAFIDMVLVLLCILRLDE